MKITLDLFEAHLKCPTKCWLRAAGESSADNSYAAWVKEQNDAYRTTEIVRLTGEFANNEVAHAPAVESITAGNWRLASSVMVRAQMNSWVLESELHAIERVPADDQGKQADFIPIRFFFTNKLGNKDKMMLGFDVFVLSEALGREISVGKIVHGDDSVTLRAKISALVGEVKKRINRIASLLSSPSPPELVLIRHCAECEFQSRCRQKAKEVDDLSLLSGMSEKERARHRSKGIFTVTQLSYTFRPRRTPRRAKNPAKPHHFALQALAILENTIYIHGTPELPECKSRVYLDIEGLPDRGFYYLIGALIVTEERETFHSFWADTESDQSTIFLQFAEAVSELPDLCVFHFGDYDAAAIKRVAAGLPDGAQQQFNTILQRSVNVLSLIYPHVYFPTFSNSMKDLGTHLGCDWPEAGATGLESIIWRNEWERADSPNSNVKTRLIDYNRSDCLALRKLTEFIVLKTGAAAIGEESQTKISRTEGLNNTRSRWRLFAQREYALKDLEEVTKCSYFDYQHEKVLVRTDRHLKTVNKKHRKFQRTRFRPNKVVELQVKKCVVCRSRKVSIQRIRKRLLFDLKFSKSGVKRWITLTEFPQYYCSKCHRQLSACSGESYPSKYGHGLMSWCMYWHVIGGLNMLRVKMALGDLFGLYIPYAEIYRFKAYMKAMYEPAYAEILQALLRSPILHIDETPVNLRGESGYVWVLTSTDKVYFFYRESREGHFLEEMLAAFQGVLISDFFTAYDPLPCRQQKCLAHLVRDIDEDLFRNPLDADLKNLAKSFGSLLKAIVGTVDRYGLKRRHLQKHKRGVNRFLETVSATHVDSELASKYKKRFERSGPKMFTFLDYDGVPWNNNNAEHAIKFFAKFRRNADGRFTEGSLRDYLVLASVFTTCEFNNVNPLKFLLSKEKALEGLLRMAGRRARGSKPPENEMVQVSD